MCREVLRTDLAFFLDSSASLGMDNFNKSKRFVKTIANAFDISAPNTHVSVITYSSSNRIEFDFERHTNKGDLFTALDAIPYRAGRFTYIDSALLLADKNVFTPQNKARNDAFRVSFCSSSYENLRYFSEISNYYQIGRHATFILQEFCNTFQDDFVP